MYSAYIIYILDWEFLIFFSADIRLSKLWEI